ncbi:MAG: aspartate aminotransferase family protein [Gemmatimonadales bacterium]
MEQLLHRTADLAARYLASLDHRPVKPPLDAVAALAELDVPMPAAGTPSETVLEELDRVGSPATVASAGGRFFGFVVGGALPATVAANWLATAWDQEAGMAATSPATVAIEAVAHRWLLELFELPADTATAFVTGATMANFTALAAARHAVLARAGWNVEADGLFGAPPVTVIVGEEVHPTLRKALGLLGLGRNRVVTVAADGQGRMRPEALPPIAGPTIVCVQAGNVNSGNSDPIGRIADVVGTRAWIHVDGAFGLWAAISPETRALVAGYQRASSWATDGHKWLNVPYDSGYALVRDGAALRAAMALSAAYLPSGAGRQPDHFTPELSRRARGVETWAALRALGRDGVRELVERCCRLARRFAAGLEAAGYPPLNDVVLNQVCVPFGDEATTDRVVALVQDSGECWCGGTTWRGRRAMRISVSSWATTEADVDRSLRAILAAAAAVRGDG